MLLVTRRTLPLPFQYCVDRGGWGRRAPAPEPGRNAAGTSCIYRVTFTNVYVPPCMEAIVFSPSPPVASPRPKPMA